MASTRRERPYISQIAPVPTYHWSVPLRLHGTKYQVGVRTSEIHVFDEGYRYPKDLEGQVEEVGMLHANKRTGVRSPTD